MFRESSYNKRVPESFELNEEILTVTANDEDTGVNKEISYYIVAGNDEGIDKRAVIKWVLGGGGGGQCSLDRRDADFPRWVHWCLTKRLTRLRSFSASAVGFDFTEILCI